MEELRQNEAVQLESPSSGEKKNAATQNEAVAAEVIDEYAAKFNALTPLLEQKQRELEKILVFKQILFELDEQLKWINQTSRQLELTTAKPAQTLFDATNTHKKVCDLERSLLNNHKPNVDKLLNQSKLLLGSTTSHEDQLAIRTDQLETEWLRLLRDVEQQRLMTARALSEQQCLDEINQIVASLNEKWLIIESNSVIQSSPDETLLNKHLAKLNQLKDDLKGYNVKKKNVFFSFILFNTFFCC